MYNKLHKKISEIIQTCNNNNYVFRGENRCYNTPASSQLFREYQAAGSILENHVFESEKIIVDQLRSQTGTRASDIEILTELQHYGGTTTLIDFTCNLSIALFFSCEGFSDESGKIILLDITGMKAHNDIEAGKIKDDADFEVLNPAGKNPRAVSQSSIFVRSSKGYLDSETFKEIEIDKDLKGEVLCYLKQFHDIHPLTIYCDLHGFIQNQKNLYYQQIYYDHKVKENATADSFYARGVAKYASGRLTSAVEDFDEAIRLDPQHNRALHQRGLIKICRRDKSGIEDYKLALKIRQHPLTIDNLRIAENQPDDYWKS